MKDKVYKVNEPILGQVQPSDSEKEKMINYLTEFFLGFDGIMQEEVELDSKQKSYLADINRGKVNAKV